MKTTRTLLLISIALLALLLFRTCQENKHDCTLNQEEVIKTYKSSKHTISIEETKKLYSNYKERFVPRIAEIQKDSVSGIFRQEYLPTEYSIIPLQKLKDYINFIEVLQEKNEGQIISGVAINFGAYGLDKQINSKPTGSELTDPTRFGDYKGRLTNFLTPTFFQSGKHIPFCIDYDDANDKFKGTFVSLNNLIAPEVEGKSIPEPQLRTTTKRSTLDDDYQSTTSNEFNVMPPKK